MSSKILGFLGLDKRKAGKNVKSEKPRKNPNVESIPSSLDFNVIAPSPQLTETNLNPAFANPSNGSIEQSNTFQTSYTGGAFKGNDLPLDSKSRAGSSTRRSKSIKRKSIESGRDSGASIVLPSKGECETIATHERRPLPFLSSSSGLDVPPSVQPPTSTEGGLTTCDDGGHDFEVEFLKNNPTLIVARDYSMRRPVVESVRDDLNARGTKIQSATDSKGWFIPCTRLHQIMTYETIRLLLHECDPTLSEKLVREKAAKIAPSLERSTNPFRRVFAILILIRKPSAIFSFLENEIDDTQLPFYVDEEDRPPHDVFQIADWKDQDIRDFCQTQWEVWPVFFSVRGEKIVHYECRRGEILPFVNLEWGFIKKGGSGEVARYGLHSHQQSLKRYTIDGPDRAVVVKKLYKPNSRAEFDKEHLMLDRLTQYAKTPHLVKLLATYEMPKYSSSSESKDYFLVFECADSTLSELWLQDPKELMDRPRVAQWVASQSQGLATALSSIHNFDRAIDDPNDRTHGFHGDIKPDNVLRYKGWNGEEHELGVLQITDFGLSSFHHTQTADAIKIRHLTGDYRPPESEMLLTVSASLDTWTLGCLSLDFLTWLVKGPDGLKIFKRARESGGLFFDIHTCFWEVTEQDNVTTVALSKAVLNWVTDLCQDPNSSQFVRDFCELIINQMLVIENKGFSSHESNNTKEAKQKMLPTERIQTLKLAEDMGTFIGKDISYYTPSKPRGQLNLYGPRHCIEVSKPRRQLYKEAVGQLDPYAQEVANPQLEKLQTPSSSRRREKSPAKLWVQEKITQIYRTGSRSRTSLADLNSFQRDG